jgi:hypothetical protein
MQLSADDVCAIVTLAESSLRVGSDIDVFCDGLFWEAEIVRVAKDRFRFRFLHGGTCGGWVLRREFLVSWRFPVRTSGDVWKAKLFSSVMNHD